MEVNDGFPAWLHVQAQVSITPDDDYPLTGRVMSRNAVGIGLLRDDGVRVFIPWHQVTEITLAPDKEHK